MKKLAKLSTITLGIAAISLSTSLWASSGSIWDPLNDTVDGSVAVVNDLGTLGMHHMTEPVYIVTDKTTGTMYGLDGIKCGKVVSDHGNMVMHEQEVIGDKITDTRTHRSGVITGIKSQGTMEVVHENGKTVRYQYVTFKIKPTK